MPRTIEGARFNLYEATFDHSFKYDYSPWLIKIAIFLLANVTNASLRSKTSPKVLRRGLL